MTRKDGWENSANGPDWMDIEAAIRATDSIHLGKTGVHISPLGTGSSGGLKIEISTVWENVPGSAQLSGVTSVSEWPCRFCKSFVGHLLSGIYNHDFAIGEAYQQRSFKEA